jgi:7,8-dihydropterin-6-yl-methyl-4-(beta-D-ribofuranosyl)aminobenzene 5'-phosphate synthase
MVENMSRLDIDASRVEVVVCSHGHVDHTAGLAGLARRLGPTNLPVIIHPEFWSRRRITLPGMDPVEMPTTSRRAITDAGFAIIEDQCPSFVLNGAALVTGEVARTTDFEHGMPYQEAWHDGHWEPDPLILDDQALVVHLGGRGPCRPHRLRPRRIVNIARSEGRTQTAPTLRAG